MALSNEERYGIDKYITWSRQYHEKKMAKTSKLSSRIDWLDGVLDALDNAEFALEYCNTPKEYVDELKTLYQSEWNSYQELSKTTNYADAHYYHASAHTLKALICNAELMFI